MKVWGLYSTRVDLYNSWELIELFADEATAQRTKAELIGKRVHKKILTWVWEDDEDLPDLVVRPLDIRPS